MRVTEPGRVLSGRYRLGSVIGRGGMGVVWRARDELLGRDVAVKEIIWPPHLTEQEKQLACDRATREAQMAARLTHRNVIRIYDIVEEDGHPWIVMEYLPYRSLRDVLAADGPLPPARAAQVGLGILAALRAAHAEGILHRDVKPANVLVGPDGRTVLTDFGIARAADSPTVTTAGALLGSPSYLAPERARGTGSGPQADLWGLGATLYTAVEGHPPFERDGVLPTLTAVVTDEPDQAYRAGPLWPVIGGLLRKDPAARLDAAETERLLSAVAHGASGGAVVPAPRLPEQVSPGASRADPSPVPALVPATVPAPVPPRPARASVPPGQRHRGPLLALAAVFIIAAAAIAATLALTGAPRQPAASSGKTASSGGTTGPAGHPGASPGTSTRATAPASAGGTSARPATPSSASPSSAPPSSAPAAGSTGYGALPPGYHRFTNSTGFSIGVPDGWVIQHVGHYVYINDPSNPNVFLLIDQSDSPKPDPLADWQQQAANRASGYPGYHLIRLASVNYPQAEKAADWEFTYDNNGVMVHILNRNILANADHAYALYWSTPESDWTADYHYFAAFAATFVPAPASQT